MNDYERAESDIGKIYRILKEKNYFQESDFNTRYLPQLQRNMRQFQNISTKLVVAKLKPKEFVNWHNQNVPTLCYDESNFQLEVMTLLCQHGLSTFELFKRFLLNILDLEKINEKTGNVYSPKICLYDKSGVYNIIGGDPCDPWFSSKPKALISGDTIVYELGGIIHNGYLLHKEENRFYKKNLCFAKEEEEERR